MTAPVDRISKPADTPNPMDPGEISDLTRALVKARLDVPVTPSVDAWLEQCLQVIRTPEVMDTDNSVIGRLTKVDPQQNTSSQKANSGYTLCTDTVDHQDDGVMMPISNSSGGGEDERPHFRTPSHTDDPYKARQTHGHITDSPQPSQPLTRAGTPAPPPDELTKAKPVVVSPNMVSPLVNSPMSLSSPPEQQPTTHPSDVSGLTNNAHRGVEGPSHRLTDIRYCRSSSREVKGKFPKNGSAPPHVTKGAVAISRTGLVVDRCTATSVGIDGQCLDQDPHIRVELNTMCENINLSLYKIKNTIIQFDSTCKTI